MLLTIFQAVLSQSFNNPFDIKFINLSTEQGLIQNTVTSVEKDQNGFIWIGTAAGVSRYDGYEFRNYAHNPEDSTSISANFISDILCDHKNNIWITTTRKGLNLYNRDYDNFERILFSDQHNLNLIRAIFEDHNHHIWFGTLGSGLVKYDHENGMFVQYVHSVDKKNSIYSDYVTDIDEDENGNLWISQINGAISKFDPEQGTFTNYIYNTSEYNNLFHPFRGKILYDSGTVWICNYPDGLQQFDTATERFYRYPVKTYGKGISNNDVTDIVRFTDEFYLVTVDHGGLNLLDKYKRAFHYYRSDPLKPFTISNDQLLCIYKDDLDIFWIGNYRGGVNLFTPIFNEITNYTYDGTPGGLSAKSVLSILQDSKGKIWVGTDGGGLDILDPKKGVIKVFRNEPGNASSLNSDIILTMLEDSRGKFWIGTYYGGLNEFDPETGRSIRFSSDDPEHYFNSTSINYIYEDRDHNIWVSTLNKGFSIKRNGTRNFENVTTLAGVQLQSLASMYLLEDSRKRIWLGFDDLGIGLFDPKKNTLTNYTNKPGDSNSFSSNSVNFIFEDRQKRIWIGTQNGLNLYAESTGDFIHMDKKYNFHTCMFNTMLQDNNDIFWIGTIVGLIKFDMKSKDIRLYDYSDNLQGNEFNRNAVLKANDGKFYFGGIKGLSAFYPDRMKENLHKPPVEIVEFYIYNKVVKWNTPGSPLKKNIQETDRIDLNYNQNFIGFKYVALNYLHTEKDQYAYYLEPLEKDWNNVGNRRIATYTNLSPGKYTFHVKGSNHDHIWNDIGKSIEIYIEPPFWMTSWFRAIIAVFVIALFYLFYYLRIRNINTQKVLLERRVNEQTKELKLKNQTLYDQTQELNEINTILEERQQRIEEQTVELRSQAETLAITNSELEELNRTKDKFFSIIAHDLKSPFSSIFGFAELLKLKIKILSPEKLDMYINSIYNSSKKIFNLLENLLQWSRAQSKHLKYVPHNLVLNTLIKDVLQLLMDNIKSKNIVIENNTDDHLTVYADHEMINLVLRNLISNAVKYTSSGGKIEISAELKDNMVMVSVKDNGIGMTEARLNNLFRVESSISTEGTDGETGTGLGLLLCKDFIRLNKGEIWAESKENEGTTFYFTIASQSE